MIFETLKTVGQEVLSAGLRQITHLEAFSLESPEEKFEWTDAELERILSIYQRANYAQVKSDLNDLDGTVDWMLLLATTEDEKRDWLLHKARIATLLGRTLAETGDSGEALEAYHRAVELFHESDALPGDIPASHAADLGIALYKAGRIEEASDALQNAINWGYKTASTHRYLGLSLFKLEKYEEAEGHLRKALAEEVDDVRILRRWALSLEKLGEKEQAIEAYQSTVNALLDQSDMDGALEILDHILILDPKLYHTHITRAEILRLKGQLDEAESAVRIALQKDEEKALAWAVLGGIQLNKGDSDAAYESYREAQALDSTNPYLLLMYAAGLEQLGELQESVDILQRCIEEVPEFYPAYEVLVQVYVRSENPDKALEVLSQQLIIWPDEFTPLLQKAAILSHRGDYREALAAVEKALVLEPDDADALAELSRILIKLEKYELAFATLVRSLRLYPDNPETMTMMAEVMREVGRPEDAIGMLTKAFSLEPEAPAPGIILEQARSLAASGQLDEALAALNDGLESIPDDLDLLLEKAFVLYQSGRTIDSLVVVRRVLDEHPDTVDAWLLIGMNYLAGGKLGEALTAVYEALGLSPHHPDALIIKSQIERAMGEPESALKTLSDTGKERFEIGRMYFEKGRALTEIGDLEKAALAQEKALELEPDNAAYALDLAGTYRLLDWYDKAFELLRKTKKSHPDNQWIRQELALTLAEKGDVDVAYDIIYPLPETIDVSTTVELARVFRFLGREEQASELLKVAIETTPDDADWLKTELVGAYNAMREHKKALKEAGFGEEAETPDAALLIERAIALNSLGRYADASSEIDGAIDAIEKEPGSPVALLEKSVINRRVGDLPEAVAAIQVQPELVNSAPGLAELSMIYLALNKKEEALDKIRAALKLEPETPLYLGYKGKILTDRGDLDEAVATYQEALNLSPPLAHRLYQKLAYVERDLGHYKEAIDAFDRYLMRKPDDEDVIWDKGEVEFADEQYDEAQATFEKLLEMNPEHIEGLRSLAYVILNLGDYAEAIEKLHEAIEILEDAGDVGTTSWLKSDMALTYSTAGDYVNALAAAKEGVEIVITSGKENPWAQTVYAYVCCDIAAFQSAHDVLYGVSSKDWQTYYTMGWALQNLGKIAEAEEAYRRATKMHPGDVGPEIGLATTLREAGFPDEASEMFQSIIDRETSKDRKPSVEILSWIGWCNYELGNCETAVQNFNDAIELRPDRVSMYFDLALAKLCSGDGYDAEKKYMRAFRVLERRHPLRRLALLYVAMIDLIDALQREPEGGSENHLKAINKIFKKATKKTIRAAKEYPDLEEISEGIAMLKKGNTMLKKAIRQCTTNTVSGLAQGNSGKVGGNDQKFQGGAQTAIPTADFKE